MKVIVRDTYDAMSKAAFDLFRDKFDYSHVFGFAAGKTPIGLYRLMVEAYRAKELKFDGKVTFNLDEYYPISPKDNDSFRRFMDMRLFRRVDIDADNIRFPDAQLPEGRAVASYMGLYMRDGPVDFQVVGIGENGHIGFNEPGSAIDLPIRIVRLSEETMKANGTAIDRAITMGVKEIMQSRTIILLASGGRKSEAVKKAIEGEVSSDVPASFLQLHRDTTFVLDREAAKLLS